MKQGAHYMQGWLMDEIRKAEGEYLNGKGPIDHSLDKPIRSYQANAPIYKPRFGVEWIVFAASVLALITVIMLRVFA